MNMILDHPYFATFMTVVATLLAKYLWDRFLAQNSRITVPMCDLIRSKCREDILKMVQGHTKQLDCGEHSFEKMANSLMVIIITLLKICEKQSIECDDIHKLMVEKGLLS